MHRAARSAPGQYTLCRDGRLARAGQDHASSTAGTGSSASRSRAASAGDIVAIAGIEDIDIGDTIADRETPQALPPIRIDEPTIAMIFCVNTSPWAGREGEHVTSRKLRERLCSQKRAGTSACASRTPTRRTRFKVTGRGELQLAILIETMRREGYEMQVSKPDRRSRARSMGAMHEPMELLLIDVPEDYIGVVSQLLAVRKGKMTNMTHGGSSRVRLEFAVPSRGLIGFRSHFLTDTRGTGIMNALFDG